jgi:hypothetical protein
LSKFSGSPELVNELVMEAMEVEAEGKHPRWHKRAALSTLLMAVLAAIGA